MKKTIIIEIPKETYHMETKPTISELIILSLSEPRSSVQVMKDVNVLGNTLRPILSNMVTEGRLETMKCDKCGIGVMYKKK